MLLLSEFWTRHLGVMVRFDIFVVFSPSMRTSKGTVTQVEVEGRRGPVDRMSVHSLTIKNGSVTIKIVNVI